MAKKAVATLQTGKTEGRSYTKVIKMVKSPKTGAYIFDEQMVQNDKVQDFFKKYSKRYYIDLRKFLSNTRKELFLYLFCWC